LRLNHSSAGMLGKIIFYFDGGRLDVLFCMGVLLCKL